MSCNHVTNLQKGKFIHRVVLKLKPSIEHIEEWYLHYYNKNRRKKQRIAAAQISSKLAL